jgi:hypothetical protein
MRFGRRGPVFSALALTCGLATACGSNAAKGHKDAGEVFESDPGNPLLNPPRPPDYLNDDSGAFGPPAERENDAGATAPEGGRVTIDAGNPQTGLDAGPSGDCVGPLLLGDVKIVELMISTQSAIGDRGEWVEIQSTRACTLNLNGLTIASPRSTTATDSVTITTDTFLPPNGTFLVADSSIASLNGALPPVLFSWAASDVLKNTGDTVTLTAGTTTIDTLTYPSFTNLTPGRALSFPADCAWSDRASWARWSYAFRVYSGVLQGTPNADNTDVACY